MNHALNLNDSIKIIKGVGEKTCATLENMGIFCVRDALEYTPIYYKDLSCVVSIAQADINKSSVIHAKIVSAPRNISGPYKKQVISFNISDGSGVAEVFLFNMPWAKNAYKQGKEYYFYGKTELSFLKLRMANPLIFKELQNDILPYYAGSFSQTKLRKIIQECLNVSGGFEDYSEDFLQQCGILKDIDAYKMLHTPTCSADYEKAQESFSFKRMLVFAQRLKQLELQEERGGCDILTVDIPGFCSRLSFSPTAAQMRVMQEISQDIMRERPMNRIVQGDVGSGKTILAFFAMYCAAISGKQALFMAPTEILAHQHYAQAQSLFSDFSIALITNSVKKSQRELARHCDIIIGTHALLSERLTPSVIITDEQHRFGVKQRARLAMGGCAHTLVMSATPIPRTLALMMYGKTDISLVDELPPGRKPIKTHLVPENKRADMYAFIRDSVKQGYQVYVVCPLIEQGETELCSVDTQTRELKKQLSGIRIDALHGKMNDTQKQQTMGRFANGEIDVLVCTTVIEVGVNVPNANIMVIEEAQRFGLATLHQLRGRVGRGQTQSYCFLMLQKTIPERLKLFKTTSDGFKIADFDLQIRGGGQLFGLRQHGKHEIDVTDLRQYKRAQQAISSMSFADAQLLAARTQAQDLEIVLN